MLKATIRGVEIEGTADDFRQLLGLADEEEASLQSGTELNVEQYRTWSIMVSLDPKGKGIHYARLAEALDCTSGAANQRIARIMKMGYAEKVRPGIYRAIT